MILPVSTTPRAVVVTLAVLGGALLLPGSAQAERSTSDPHAVAMISRAMNSLSFVSFSGTQFVAAWSATNPSESTSTLAEIEHTAGSSTVVRARGSAEVARVDPPEGGAAWLASRGPLEVLTDAYALRVSGAADIAGRSSVVIDALRFDGSAAARLWLDEESALPLRRETYNRSGKTVSASAFVDISMSHGDGTIADLGQRVSSWPERERHLDEAELDELRASGWACPRELGSGLVLYEARQVGSAVQLSYTDGVAAVSVFEQPGRLDPDAVDGFTAHETGDGVYYQAPGPPARMVWEMSGYVVTVIADAPATAESVLAAMPPGGGESSGLLARVGRGAQRLMSWVSPFD